MSRYSVITDKCSRDLHCISVCLRKAIHPTAAEADLQIFRQLYINPRRCIGCGACVTACQNGAIFEIGELPSDMHHFAAANAVYYAA